MLNNQFIEIKFLREQLASLRQQKSHYLSSKFCDQLESLSDQMTTAISENRRQPKISRVFHNLEEVSTGFVDFSLESIEIELQKLESEESFPELYKWQELEDVACDLFQLAVYIRFTINPIEFLTQQRTKYSAETMLV